MLAFHPDKFGCGKAFGIGDKQKQPPGCVLRKRCSENMQQIYRRTTKSKIDFNWNFIEITLRLGCSPVNLLHIFRTPFPKNTSGWLLLDKDVNDCHIIKKKRVASLFAIY